MLKRKSRENENPRVKKRFGGELAQIHYTSPPGVLLTAHNSAEEVGRAPLRTT